jgi:hypothetical protein
MLSREIAPPLVPITEPQVERDVATLRATCAKCIVKGGEEGEIAAEILRISTVMSAMSERIRRFLES